jgi:hypothetical protein
MGLARAKIGEIAAKASASRVANARRAKTARLVAEKVSPMGRNLRFCGAAANN